MRSKTAWCGSTSQSVKNTFRLYGPAAVILLTSSPLFAQQVCGTTGNNEQELLERIARLERRVEALERNERQPAGVSDGRIDLKEGPKTQLADKSSAPPLPSPATIRPGEVTFNFNVEGYYSFNALHPGDHVNTLRAYDSRANTLSLSELGVVVERAVDPENGVRSGFRLDLLFGQLNDFQFARPAQNRNLLQAYGTYVIPAGKGLQVDFGQFFSPIGLEGFYTADQIALSRGYILDIVPLYHVGLRTTYSLTNAITLQYSQVNGVNEGPEGRGLGSQIASLLLHEHDWSAQVNYFRGQPDFSTPATGSPTGHPINLAGANAQIANAYGTWTRKHTSLSSEFIFYTALPSVEGRPLRATAGSIYMGRELSPRWKGAVRLEHFNDAAGLISASPRTLNEISAIATLKPDRNFQVKLEYRHDWSSTPVFHSGSLPALSRNLNTVTLGLDWRFGKKNPPW